VSEAAKPGVEPREAGTAARTEETLSPQFDSSQFDARLPQLSRGKRLQIPLIAGAVYAVIRTIGPTIRFETLGERHYHDAHVRRERVIAAFWHRCIFSAVWYWRGRGIVVLNTTHFDGQWTRRVIERLGFGTVQGSSTRGGVAGLMDMARKLDEGLDVAFTIDGPRGPRYVAKPGPVILARRTAQPIVVFHVGLENARTLEKAWDLFQIPHFFTRAIMVVAPPIYVPTNAASDVIHSKQAEMQTMLERVRDVAETWFEKSPQERERLRQEWNRL